MPLFSRIVQILLWLFATTDLCTSQYSIQRQDPFALLFGTLQTYQRASCDGEELNLDCPANTTISIQFVQYGRTRPSAQVMEMSWRIVLLPWKILDCARCSDESGSKIFWPGSGQQFMAWVWIWKISPKNVKFFIFFPSGKKKSLRIGSKSTRVKGRLASYLLRV